MGYSQFTEEDNALISREYAPLAESARQRCADQKEFDLVQKAFDFANSAHRNVRRRSGEPYILHPIAVARIVISEIGLGYKSIIAALLHDVVEDTDYTTEDIRKLFGDKIASLVEGLTKIKTVLDNEDKEHIMLTESLQAENFKRILLTLNDDIRVVLIKLADRLHNCRTIEYMPEHKRDKILSETMYIFIPLAHRLGLYGIKSEMENIWLRYKEPDAYNDICQRISQNVENRDHDIDNFIKPMSKALEDRGYIFSIKKRVKTPYSIWRKMRDKDVRFEEVYDLYAVRIIFNPDPSSNESERDQCYHIFTIITGIYPYNKDRIRDWVEQPKSNGYEALHCTLMSRFGVWIEVQIRTKRMDDIDEKGIAAHWVYKKEGFVSQGDHEMDRWLGKVKEILSDKSNINSAALLDIIHDDLTTSEIVVFTPKGHQRTIINGATALDFAYLIHTEVGNKAIAAKVNFKLVPLSYRLSTGDVVEIITAENSKPKSEWLGFLRTRHAISLVMEWFRSDNSSFVALGAQLLSDILRSMGHKIDNEMLKKLLIGTDLTLVDELYFRIGLGLIKTDRIRSIVQSDNIPTSNMILRSRDLNGVRYIVASCCCPIPGDPVVGFRNKDGSITVHKKSCRKAEIAASKNGDRMVSPDWTFNAEKLVFPVVISISGLDRVGLLSDITHYISQIMGVNMRRLNLASENGIFSGEIEMFVRDTASVEEILSNLGSIEGIQKVTRKEIK